MKQTQEKRAWRFTALDLILVIVVLAVIGAAIYFFGPFGNNPDDASEKVELLYTIEIKGVEEEYIDNVQVGDTMIESVNKTVIGTITAIETMPYTDHVLNEEAGVIEEKQYPGLVTMLITVQCEAVSTERAYTVEGYRLAIGKLNYIQLPRFVGSGYGISLTELN